MRSSSSLRILTFTALAGLTGLIGCSSGSETPVPGSGGAAAGSGGSVGSGGAPAGSGGSSGSGGAVGTGGSVAPVDASPDVMMSEVAPEVPGTGYGGIAEIENFSVVKKSEGCGMAPGQALNSWVRYAVTIPPPGSGRGTGNRVYYIKLPANYDSMKVYRLIFTAPGCGGAGNQPTFDFASAAGTEGVIQIGVQPDPGASQNGPCFDDKRTDSVEYKYFDTMLAAASKKLCFDLHKVFMAGHSSGSWLANQWGCVYGMTKIRAIAPASGGLADQPGEAPPCTMLPTPGIWSHNEDEPKETDNPAGNPFVGTRRAITRALKVNRCVGDFDTSKREPYTAIGTAAGICEKFSSCPPEFPIVLCHPAHGGHTDNLGPVAARTWEFFKAVP
jgi:poly(3-hydroxybutyrate) depolymerase